jgi:hypothetical protein
LFVPGKSWQRLDFDMLYCGKVFRLDPVRFGPVQSSSVPHSGLAYQIIPSTVL